MKSKKEYDYTVLFEPAAEGGYVVTCPALPGLVTEGDTLEEARAMAKEAIEGYLESLRTRRPADSQRCPADTTAGQRADSGRAPLTCLSIHGSLRWC